MVRTARNDHVKLLLMLLAITAVSIGTMMSCGDSGGGGSDHGLCAQCGDTDGPCHDSVTITEEPRPQNANCAMLPCTVNLVCTRKLDSAQRRCYPARGNGLADLDLTFECDGARPNPNTATPRPTSTPTETEQATQTPVPTATLFL